MRRWIDGLAYVNIDVSNELSVEFGVYLAACAAEMFACTQTCYRREEVAIKSNSKLKWQGEESRWRLPRWLQYRGSSGPSRLLYCIDGAVDEMVRALCAMSIAYLSAYPAAMMRTKVQNAFTTMAASRWEAMTSRGLSTSPELSPVP